MRFNRDFRKRGLVDDRPAWLPVGASLHLDYLKNKGYMFGRGILVPTSLVPVTRSTPRTYWNSAGVLTVAAAHEPVVDYDPITLACLGFRTDLAGTNVVPNNTMVGAVAGSPGTRPTGWQLPSLSGITFNYVAVGTEDGISYVDIQAVGTAGGTSFVVCFPVGATAVAALSTQLWASSIFVKLSGGSLTNVTAVGLYVQERDSGGVALTNSFTAVTPTSANLREQRQSHTRTLSNASTAFVTTSLIVSVTNGTAVDVTLRIGMPQLEQNSVVGPVIPTAGSQVSRTADVPMISGSDFTKLYNPTQGTFVATYLLGDRLAALRIAAVSDGTAANFMEMIAGNSSVPAAGIGPYMVVTDSSVSQVINTGTAITNVSRAVRKFAFGYKLDDFIASRDGAASATDTNGTVPSAVNRMYLNAGATGAGQGGMWLQTLTYYPTKFDNAQYTELSTQ